MFFLHYSVYPQNQTGHFTTFCGCCFSIWPPNPPPPSIPRSPLSQTEQNKQQTYSLELQPFTAPFTRNHQHCLVQVHAPHSQPHNTLSHTQSTRTHSCKYWRQITLSVKHDGTESLNTFSTLPKSQDIAICYFMTVTIMSLWLPSINVSESCTGSAVTRYSLKVKSCIQFSTKKNIFIEDRLNSILSSNILISVGVRWTL